MMRSELQRTKPGANGWQGGKRYESEDKLTATAEVQEREGPGIEGGTQEFESDREN